MVPEKEQNMRLPDEEIRTFQLKGYIGPLRALPPSKVEAIADEIPSVLSGADGTHHLHLRIRVLSGEDRFGFNEMATPPKCD